MARERGYLVNVELIKSERQARGWRQEDLAREAKLSHRTIVNLEGGKPISASIMP